MGLELLAMIARARAQLTGQAMRQGHEYTQNTTRGSSMAASLKVMRKLLCREPIYCAVVNRHANPDATNFLIDGGYQKIANLPIDCYISPTQHHSISDDAAALMSSKPFPRSPLSRDKLLYYYTMDVSSLLPVLALSPEADHSVLDLCAAPGGKAFALLQFLSLGRSRGGAMALNDSTFKRLTRLKKVVEKCISGDVMRKSVRFTNRMGESWTKSEHSSYDRVLVDVRCSSDRHRIEEWIKKDVAYPNSKPFSILQEEILLGGLYSARVGGVVAYSTCTLSKTENDEVVYSTLTRARKEGMNVEIVPTPDACLPLLELCHWSKTESGVLITPTETYNCGPMFTSLIQRC